MLQLALLVTCFLQLETEISGARSLISAATVPTFTTRQTHGNYPLQLRHFSGISRASRHAKMSIQRHRGSVPPVISVGNMQNLHNSPRLSHFV